MEWYLQTGWIKRKVNLQLKLKPNRNACKVYDFEKFGLRKYLIIRIQTIAISLKELGRHWI